MPSGGNETLRTWAIALIPAVLASIAGIVFLAQMGRDINNLAGDIGSHEEITAHGTVAVQLAELRKGSEGLAEILKAQIMGLERSLDTVRHANDRLADKVYQVQQENSLIKQRLQRIENNLGSGK